ATVFHFVLQNTGAQDADVELAGWLENAVCLGSGRPGLGERRNRILRGQENTTLYCTAHSALQPAGANRQDIVFEDFERENYEGWTVEGSAFGKGPIKRADIPFYQGDVGGVGKRVVNSHASAPGNDVAQKDAKTGKLTSKPFRIERNHIHFYIG